MCGIPGALRSPEAPGAWSQVTAVLPAAPVLQVDVTPSFVQEDWGRQGMS